MPNSGRLPLCAGLSYAGRMSDTRRMSDTSELSAHGRDLSVTRVPDLHDPVLYDTRELSHDPHMYDTGLSLTMILTGENIVHYLIDRNILSAESVVDGTLS